MRSTYPENFRSRLEKHELLIGTFVKSTDYTVAEVLSMSGLDALCFDAEHVPFDRSKLDTCLLATRAYRMPSIVRVETAMPHVILSALDMGATAVQVPHVSSPEQAHDIARAARYGRQGVGGRGYAGSTRAAGYGTRPMAEQLRESAAQVTVIAQIEDAQALDVLPQLMAVDGIDAYFIGRVDLAVSMGEDSPAATGVIDAMHSICSAARAAGKPLGMFVGDEKEIAVWREQGVSLFLVGSDHSLLLRGARQLASGSSLPA
ncbi:HpcH/HpaI aldolase family protein [Paraburkholderia sp.]|uniref:HpcH/HpaI aldolase family protein n=1 Tax=Paraburkholderia sp. TaxID=1926495 RepID=UPI002D5DCAFF|nr:aldolase/citrate lyase family protein [Paraburkholderia sp.]HZZ02834.1 aldolase/citrate lyase family protein [Paraburkholderia sp.]